MIMSDYESALMGGLTAIFPTARVVGCWFHYSQNIFKRMSNLGLRDKFKNNSAFYIWLKMVMSLPLLPKNRIVDMWKELKGEKVPNMPAATFRVILLIRLTKSSLSMSLLIPSRNSRSILKQHG